MNGREGLWILRGHRSTGMDVLLLDNGTALSEYRPRPTGVRLVLSIKTLPEGAVWELSMWKEAYDISSHLHDPNHYRTSDGS
jgi:hypothetical protein